MTTTSPTKNGTRLEDKFWIITRSKTDVFEDPYVEGGEVHPIDTTPVQKSMWEQAPGIMKVFKPNNLTGPWIGRRINDEIELFMEEDDEDYAGLKECFREKGLSVRCYVPPGIVSKFNGHTHKEIMGGGKNTLLKKIMETMADKIEDQEVVTGRKVEYGLIGDFAGKVKSLVVARVDERMYTQTFLQDERTIPTKNPITGQEMKCDIIGEVRDGKPMFYCDEDTIKTYFDSLGKVNGDTVTWVDILEEKQQAERVAERAQRKQAKKHRRQVTQSTVTSPSEKSFASLSTQESNEDIKARQREKQNVKRKAQRERKRAKDEEVASETITIKAKKDRVKSRKNKDVELQEHFTFVNKLDNGYVKLKDKDGNMIERHESTVRVASVTNTASSSNIESSDSSDEEGDQLEVIIPENPRDIHRALQRNGTVMILSPTQENNGLGLTYLTRGL